MKSEGFIKFVKSFNKFETKTELVLSNNINYFINEFWTSKQRQGHSLHEISYRACFKSELPSFFIDKLTSAGDIVYDPFMGRGTTLIEAYLKGRIPVGNDINPLSVILCRPRLNPPSFEAVAKFLNGFELKKNKNITTNLKEKLTPFFHENTLYQLNYLKFFFNKETPIYIKNPDPVIDWIRMVCVNRLTGHSSGFFSGRTMPPNQAISSKAQIKINKKLNILPPERDIKKIILRKSKMLLRDAVIKKVKNYKLYSSKSDTTQMIKNSSVNLIVTSPPFLDVVDYAGDNWLRCWFCGIKSETVDISICKKPDDWTMMVRNVLKEQCRILVNGGHIAFEVGEVRSKKILLEQLVLKAAEGLDLVPLGVIINSQKFTKTSNCWGVVNGEKGTNTNRIVLFRKN